MFHHLVEPYTSSQFSRHFVASSLSYLMGSLIRVPLENIKCRQQLCTSKVLPISEIIKTLWKERRLYTGSSMIVLRDVIPGGLYFAVYFSYKEALNKGSNPISPALKKMLLGSSMGIMFWLIAYPFDLIRNVQQSASTKEKSGIRNAAKSILNDYGVKGLYRGMGITLMRTVFSSGISLYLFDLFLRLFNADFN